MAASIQSNTISSGTGSSGANAEESHCQIENKLGAQNELSQESQILSKFETDKKECAKVGNDSDDKGGKVSGDENMSSASKDETKHDDLNEIAEIHKGKHEILARMAARGGGEVIKTRRIKDGATFWIKMAMYEDGLVFVQNCLEEMYNAIKNGFPLEYLPDLVQSVSVRIGK